MSRKASAAPVSPPMSERASDETAEYAALWRQLDEESRETFRSWARWVLDDGRPETNPLRDDPRFQGLFESKE